MVAERRGLNAPEPAMDSGGRGLSVRKGRRIWTGEAETAPSGVGFWQGGGSPAAPAGWILTGRSSRQDPAPVLERRSLAAERPGRGGACRGLSGGLQARAPSRRSLPARIQAAPSRWHP